jgi:putative ABC transport system substrate-binding protein
MSKKGFCLVLAAVRLASRFSAVTFFALCSLLLAPCFSAHAQQPAKMPRVGFLGPGSLGRFPPFRQALRDLGYLEGRNIVFAPRAAEGNVDSIPSLATELVQLKVDVIVTVGTPATMAAKRGTSTIPIVMISAADPVSTGLVASLAHPGGNVTGLSSLEVELGGKRLELLKETFPKLAHIAVVWNLADAGMTLIAKQIQAAAPPLGVTVQRLGVRAPNDFGGVFAKMSQHRPDALYIIADRLTRLHLTQILEFAMNSKIPTMFHSGEYVEDGALMAYGPNRVEASHRAAYYVDKILKGAKPADIPVEQPTKFEFIINLKTAKQIGVTIPPNVLARADRVIR